MSTDSDSFVNIHSEGSKTDSDTISNPITSVTSKNIPIDSSSSATTKNIIKVDDMAYNSWQDLEQEAIGAWVSKSALTQITQKHKIHREISKENVKSLIQIARSGSGFIFDDLRRMAWPLITQSRIFESPPVPDEETMKSHEQYFQVKMDVDRLVKRFPPRIREIQRTAIQDQLVTLIMRLLISNPSFHYYQGFHDVCITFLFILGEEQSYNILKSVCNTHLKEYLEPSLEKTSILLQSIPYIIEKEDHQLYSFLQKSEVGVIFALSWILTWFSHVLKNYDNVGRMFDFFISTDKMMPFYFSAAILLHRKDHILKLDCDMASVHSYLSKLIDDEEDQLPFDQLIRDANHLFLQHKVTFSQLQLRHLKFSFTPNVYKNQTKKSYTLINIIRSILGHKELLMISFVIGLIAAFLGNNYRNKLTY